MKAIRPRYTFGVKIDYSSSPQALGKAVDGGEAYYGVLNAVDWPTKTSATTK